MDKKIIEKWLKNQKNIKLPIIIGLAGILLIAFSSIIFPEDKVESQAPSSPNSYDYCQWLEEKIAATEHMLNNVNKGNAEMISSMITDSMVGNLGVSMGDSANTVASSVQSLINNMAEFKEDAPDSESVAKEAERRFRYSKDGSLPHGLPHGGWP